ncbi:hypothetical protein HDF18_13160 [Mucilaginibacter sp. X5P1]|uniref:hypothetical protein n=1 Tax=Mucilaginibacter sp. X5P1 TaxID=2723088 RepID=UPI00161C6B21|nr:hypothetical protein [Mucilaginibacter sp. X5P1]MBB6141710.1 hypothetical protein [Mucilaginibacter sp. X5P1]
MKKLTLFTALLATTFYVSAQQMISYDRSGNTEKTKSEIFQITFEKAPNGHSASATSITGVISPIIGLAIDFVNAKIAKNKLKYSATFSNQVTFPLTAVNYTDLETQGYTIHLKRYTLNNLGDKLDSTNMVCDYGFTVSNFGPDYIQLKLSSANLIKSKAKIKNTEDNLTVSIDMKISTSAIAATKDTSKNKPTSGEAIVKIPIIRPGFDNQNMNYSTINDAFFPGIPSPDGKVNMMTIAVTVTEANIDHLDPTTVEGILKNNSSDITSVIKALFPSASTSK